MPVRHILVSNSQSYIKHYNGTLGLDVVADSQPPELLLAGSIPHVELDGPLVGVEHEGVHFHTQGGYILLLKFTRQVTFHEGRLPSPTVTNQYKFERTWGSPWVAMVMSVRIVSWAI